MEEFNEMLQEVKTMFSATEGTQEEKRQQVFEAIEEAYLMAETILTPLILFDPKYGVTFIQRINDTLGVVNEVAKEHSIEPFHIKDFDLPTVKMLEDEFEKGIDEITAE